MPINKNEITKEMVEKALNVKDAKELMALAKSEGIELTKEEAYQRRSRGVHGGAGRLRA